MILTEKRFTTQTVGNGTNQTVLTVCSLPTSGDAAKVLLRVTSRANGSSAALRVHVATIVASNSGGAISVTADAIDNQANSPGFGALNVFGSGTDVVGQVAHPGGGSTTVDHDVHVVVETL